MEEQALTIQGPLPTRPVRSRKKKAESVNAIRVPRSGISPLERRFIEYYLQLGNAYRAAVAAGYAESTATISYQLLQRPKIRAEINRRMNEQFALMEIDSNKVLQETAKMAFANMLDYLEVKDDGQFSIDLAKVNRDMGVAIQEVSYDVQGRPRIKLADKKPALELLAKFFKMPTPDAAVQGDGSGGPVTINKLDQLIVNHITIKENSQAGHQLSESKVIEGRL